MTPPTVEIPKTTLHYTLGPDHTSVATVAPGARLRFETELNLGDVLHSATDTFDRSMMRVPYVNPATGPVHVAGATPAHVLQVHIEEIELVGPGVTALVPGVGAFPDWIRGNEFGVHSRVVEIEDGHVVWDERLRIPVAPMIGVLGTAPALESISTMDNGPHGGNLDVQELTAGTTVTLPVAVEGARLFLGDCHAVQGDGELCGCGAIEIRTHTTVSVDLADRPARMVWPRFETATHLGVIACAKPLEDAFRLSVQDLVRWLADDYAMSEPDALMLLGQVAEARCTQMVNPKYTYLTKIAKRFLPT